MDGPEEESSFVIYTTSNIVVTRERWKHLVKSTKPFEPKLSRNYVEVVVLKKILHVILI
jgi:hypothetical protein